MWAVENGETKEITSTFYKLCIVSGVCDGPNCALREILALVLADGSRV
jgi:hypothetical protein